MSSVEEKRSLTSFPAVVVAYFDTTDKSQAALAQLQAMGLPTGGAYIVNGHAAKAEVNPPEAKTGWFQRMTTAARTAIGRPSKAAPPGQAADSHANDWVMIVQTSVIASDVIVELCHRHGAHQVDQRASVEVATHGI